MNVCLVRLAARDQNLTSTSPAPTPTLALSTTSGETHHRAGICRRRFSHATCPHLRIRESRARAVVQNEIHAPLFVSGTLRRRERQSPYLPTAAHRTRGAARSRRAQVERHEQHERRMRELTLRDWAARRRAKELAESLGELETTEGGETGEMDEMEFYISWAGRVYRLRGAVINERVGGATWNANAVSQGSFWEPYLRRELS
jgi:hypothetical protein